MGTVLAINHGMTNRLARGWMRGLTTGHDVVQLDGQIFVPFTIDDAVDTLDTALHNTGYTTPLIAYGHWVGGQVIYKWLRDYGPTSDIDPADVQFVATGCPERKYNGAFRSPAYNWQAILYGGEGLPDDTPYTVKELARQYDYYGDYPNDTLNHTAMSNIWAGKDTHNNYFDVSLDDDNLATYTEGTIDYMLSPTYPLPMLDWLKWLPSWIWVDQDRQLRDIVEGAYNRPMVLDPPNQNHLWESLRYFWRTPTTSPYRLGRWPG